MPPSVPLMDRNSGVPEYPVAARTNSSTSSTPPPHDQYLYPSASPRNSIIPTFYSANRSEESIPTSLTNKMGSFYLQTPTLPTSSTFAPASVLHTPVSMGTATPAIQERFNTSPGMGNYSPPRGTFPSGLQLQFVDPAMGTVPEHSADELSLEYYVSFKREDEKSLEYNLTIEDLLKEDPFTSLDVEPPHVKVEDDDDLLSSFLEFEESILKSAEMPPSPKKQRSTKFSPLPKFKPPTFPSSSLASSPKLLRKCKSFTSAMLKSHVPAGPAFSLEECSSEFRITEGNYSFQDETARLNMQLGPVIVKKKLVQKLPKSLARPTLKRSKTTLNLCLDAACRTPKVLKNMESGLVSFQLNLGNGSQ